MTMQEFFESLTHAERVRVNFVDSNATGEDREVMQRMQRTWSAMLAISAGASAQAVLGMVADPREDEALDRFLSTVKKR